MKKQTLETSVGVFVFIGLLCVAYLTIKLGKMEWLGNDTYSVEARFESVAGLKKGAAVEMAGVQIGKVDQIKLDPADLVAVVRMKIKDGCTVSDDATANIKTSGLIGDKYVQVEAGYSTETLHNGGQIKQTHSAIDLESLIGKYAFGSVDSKEQDKEEQP